MTMFHVKHFKRMSKSSGKILSYLCVDSFLRYSRIYTIRSTTQNFVALKKLCFFQYKLSFVLDPSAGQNATSCGMAVIRLSCLSRQLARLGSSAKPPRVLREHRSHYIRLEALEVTYVALFVLFLNTLFNMNLLY